MCGMKSTTQTFHATRAYVRSDSASGPRWWAFHLLSLMIHHLQRLSSCRTLRDFDCYHQLLRLRAFHHLVQFSLCGNRRERFDASECFAHPTRMLFSLLPQLLQSQEVAGPFAWLVLLELVVLEVVLPFLPPRRT